MASSAQTAEFVMNQLAEAGVTDCKKMFGEYGIYLDGKVVAMICDDNLYVKPTEAGKQYIGEPEYAPPYPGAKDYFIISEDLWEDAPWLCELIRITAPEIAPPKKKKAKSTPKS